MRRVRKREEPEANPIVKMATSVGTMYATLYADHCPRTVAAFLKLVRRKFYDGRAFSGSDRSAIVLLPASDTQGDGKGERSPLPVSPGSLVDYGGQLGLLVRPLPSEMRGLAVFGSVFRGQEALSLLRSGAGLTGIETVSGDQDVPDDLDALNIDELPDGLQFKIQTPHEVRLFSSPSGLVQMLAYFMDSSSGPDLMFTQVDRGKVSWTQKAASVLGDAPLARIREGHLQVGGEVALADDGRMVYLSPALSTLSFLDSEARLQVVVQLPGDGTQRAVERSAVWSTSGESLILQEVFSGPSGFRRSLLQCDLASKRLTRVHEADHRENGHGSYVSHEYQISPDQRYISNFGARPLQDDLEIDFVIYDAALGQYAVHTRHSLWSLLGRRLPIQQYRVWTGINDAGTLGVVLRFHSHQDELSLWCLFGPDGRPTQVHELHLPPAGPEPDILYRCWNRFHLLAYPAGFGVRNTALLLNKSGDSSWSVPYVPGAVPHFDETMERLTLLALDRGSLAGRAQVAVSVSFRDVEPVLQEMEEKERAVGTLPTPVASARQELVGMESKLKLGLLGDEEYAAALARLEEQGLLPAEASQEDEEESIEKYRVNLKRLLRQSYIQGEITRQEYRNRMSVLGVRF